MRRLLAGAAAGLALALAAPQAAAQDSIPATFNGSRETTPDLSGSASPELTARFVRRYNPGFPEYEQFSARTWLTTPAGLPAGCPAAGEQELSTSIAPGDEVFSTDTSATGSAPCNGTYAFRIMGIVDRQVIADDVAVVHGTVDVAAPPANVAKAGATFESGSVTITWTPLSSTPPDFLGYRVERREGGEWKALTTNLGPNAKSFVDSSPPSAAEAVYRVRARRSGPRGEVASVGGGTATVDLPGSGTGTTVPGDGSSTTVPGGGDGGADGGAGGADGGADGGTGTGADGGSGGSSGDRRGGSSGPQARGRTGIGTKAPRLGTPSQANFPPLLTPDAGFDEEIDYGDRSLAGEEGDELSSLFYEEDTGRGMAVPVATGFVLAAWAFHFRFLAKAARPLPVAAPGREPELLPEPGSELRRPAAGFDPYDGYDPYRR